MTISFPFLPALPFQLPSRMNEPAIGIIGGSGLYQIEGFSNLAEHQIETPFGAPSDSIVGGTMFGRRFTFCRDMDGGTGFCRTN